MCTWLRDGCAPAPAADPASARSPCPLGCHAGGIKEQQYVRLRSEAKAPFRLPRIVFLGGLAVGAAIGLFIITGRLVAATQGAWLPGLLCRDGLLSGLLPRLGVCTSLLTAFLCARLHSHPSPHPARAARRPTRPVLQAARERPTCRRRCKTSASTRRRWRCLGSWCTVTCRRRCAPGAGAAARAARGLLAVPQAGWAGAGASAFPSTPLTLPRRHNATHTPVRRRATRL